MPKRLHVLFLAAFCSSLLASSAVSWGKTDPIQPEPMGLVETLPDRYPNNWLMVMDAAFFHMLSGKIMVLDTSGDTVGEQFKGMVNASFIASMTQSTERPEFYVAETFYSRGVRGERTDVITIYENKTLDVAAEIILPGGKRASMMPERYGLTLIDQDRYLLVFNFTPAQSVTVVDLIERKVVSEVQIAGCVLAYPMGQRGFTSICSNGGFLSTTLNEDGSLKDQTRLDSVFDTDDSPIFERPGIVNSIAYFPTFTGKVQPVDLSGDVAKPLEVWSLVNDEEEKANWRPGGIALTAVDSNGHLYVLMHPNGGVGTQNNGGSEVWVFDVQKKARTQRIPLQGWGLSIEVTRGDEPLLIVTNGEFGLDVHNAKDGAYIKTITDFGQETPFLVHGAR